MPPMGVTTATSNEAASVKSVRHFTWRELSRLNRPDNAHVAVRGKVIGHSYSIVAIFIHIL